jgi:hypothetical protein
MTAAARIAVAMQADATKHAATQASLHFVALSAFLNDETDPDVAAVSLARCRAFIARKVPAVSGTARAGTHQAVMQFVVRWPEARSDEAEALFREYLGAGYFGVNDHVARPYATGSQMAHPLELCIRPNRNVRAMVAFIEAGADLDQVPAGDAGDFLGFIAAQGGNAMEMLASAKAAIMRRGIRASEAPEIQPAAASKRRTIHV